MPVIEYKLHKVGRGLQTPDFVSDGGYWSNPADNTRLGWCPAESDRAYWVPDSLTELTKAEVVTRALNIHSATPYQSSPEDDSDPVDLTTEQVTQLLEDWYDSFVASQN